MVKFHGRKKPYTTIGIGRVPCARCGLPSVYQWSICANGNRYLGFCSDCDVAMNAMVMEFVGFENAKELLDWYIKEQGYDGSHPAFTVHVSAVGISDVSVPVPDRHVAPRHRALDLYEVERELETL